ncbi:hypothetical protein [Rariglobus hedericola]|uniref:hypothetical protein n=1 Tax=Rariglobus hedericola TaxID=2597822 RepID=UPI001EF02557|nr:hypothetical protein [Rariglobus hedericola]
MAKKTASLSFRDIVLGADAEVIRQAHEARVKIDLLIEERQRAYERIAELETQVEDVLGETGAFPFPAPPLAVAGFDPKADTVTRGAAKKPARTAANTGADEDTADSDDSASTDES